MIKKIALICYTHHKRSKAFDYLNDILSERFVVVRVWDDSWQGGNPVDLDEINEGDFDCIVFTQVFPKYQYLKKIKCRNVTWIPMYDSEVNSRPSKYLSLIYNRVKVFSFSRTLYERLLSYGSDIEYGKFFLKPISQPKKANGSLKVFYWPRTELINWDLVKKLLGGSFKGKVIIQNAPDPKNSFRLPSTEDYKKYNIEVIDRWLDFEEGLKVRSSCDIFVAPRLYEGIGLTFLEAMASGVAVLSPNNSTMNEYIVNGINGYLYDVNNPQEVDFTEIDKIKANAYKTIIDGYKDWQKNQSYFLSLVERKYVNRASILQLIATYMYFFLYELKSKLFSK